jgi:26S proteasome regulatory subunit N7
MFCLATRDLKKAAALLLESVATFTATELFEFQTLLLYAALTALPSLDRGALKSKVPSPA